LLVFEIGTAIHYLYREPFEVGLDGSSNGAKPEDVKHADEELELRLTNVT
jgi:hypothetical protein